MDPALQTLSLDERKIKVSTSLDSTIMITRAKKQIDISKPSFIFTSKATIRPAHQTSLSTKC